MPIVRAEYELQPELIGHAAALSSELGPGAEVAPLTGHAGAPPDGLVVTLEIDADDPLAAVAEAARRLAAAFAALGMPPRAVNLECEGLPPVRIETRPQAHPYTG